MRKKLRSLIAAVVAAACLYTPTAVAEPVGVEPNTPDSTIQIDGTTEGHPVDNGEPTVEPDGTDDVPGEDNGTAADTPEADTPQAVAQDWTGAIDNLVLSTQGLTITPSEPSSDEAGVDISGTSTIPEGLNGAGVSRGNDGAGALGGLSESEPEQRKDDAARLQSVIDATLNLTFVLDTTAGDGRADGSGLGAIVPGDHFSVPMPEGITAADDDAAFDVFMRDADGNATTVRVGEAATGNGALTVTFTDPTDTQTQETVAEPASVTALIDMPVTLDAALVQDEASTIAWTVRTVTDAEGNQHPETLTLDVPARADVLKTLGLVGKQDAESEDTDKTAQSDEPKTTPNQAATLSANASAAETTYALSGNASLSLEITWCDNNYSGRPKTSELTGFNPQFQIDRKGNWISLFKVVDGKVVLDENDAPVISDEARTALHLGDTNPSWVNAVSVSQSSLNTYVAAKSGLPKTLTATTKTPVDADGDGVQDTDEFGNPAWTESATTTQSIIWRLNDTNTYPERYQFGRSDDLFGDKAEDAKPHRYLMLTDTVTFTVDGRIGGENLSSIFQEEQARYFQFGASIDNKNQGSGTLNTLIAQDGNPTTDKPLVLTDNGTTATITGTLPMYDENGDPIVYYIKYNGPSPDNTGEGAPEYKEGADYFQVSYNNAASDSHGSATDAVYSGGTMMLRRMGTTTYDATKVWLDNGDQENRPATSFTLWRYARRDGSSASTASQVQLNALDDSGTETNALEYVSIDVPAKSGGQVGDVSNAVDLGQLLEEKYGAEALGSLPKYDPDGYPYIYALREDGVPSGYEIVYGSVKAVNEIEDTAPNYEESSYTGTSTNWVSTKWEDSDGTRPADDPLVYNGGTITNRITGQTEVSATKTWEISAFQDDLADVTTTFQLQSRVKDDADSTWTDVEGDNTTHTETGWKSETLTRTFSGTFPKYNALGKELEYRWVESGVSINGQDTGFERDGKGGGTFTLTLPTPEGETETLNFTSMFEAADTEDGIDTITNTFENTAEEHVEKWWQQPDGSMAQIKPDPNGYKEYPDLDTSGKVTFNVFQDGVQVGSFTMDGSSNKAQPLYKDGTEASGVADGFDKATWAETGSYDVTLANLPKYSPEGRRYSYLVLEESVSGWHTDRIYDAENHLTKVENTVGPGEGSEIRVMKKWVDGDDAAHRQPVVVQLVVTDKNGIRSEATNDDGTPKYEYAYGETVTAVSQDNNLTKDGQIILSADNSWFAEVEIPIGGLSYSQFKLVEVGLLQDDGTINPVVNNSVEAVEAYGNDTVWANVGWNYDDTQSTSRVANDEHVYETTAGKDDEPLRNEDMQAVVASNRRIGLFDLTVQKDWKDGGDASKRPDARLVLTGTEYPKAFSIDENGNVWVQVSDNRLPVNAPTGPNDTDRRQLNAETDHISLNDDGSLVMQVDTSADDDGKYYFFGLPKYDASGNVVHYDVTEEWMGDHTCYVNSKSVGDYTVGTQHFHDKQLITFTNRRTGTRDVTFYKQWNDFYVNDELHQRPDIYLTLYRVTMTGRDANGNPTYSEPVAVDGYVRWLWQGTASDNPQYDQMATIHGLPAYDGDGNAYIYYASESTAADATSLDYDDVKFAYASIDEARAEAEENGEAYPAGENAVSVGAAESTDPTQNGTGYAIHEDGTFVNTLTSELVARGTKLWEDVPGNVVQTQDRSDLPDITVYLQRRLAGEDWPSLRFDVDENGNWSIVSNGEGENPGAVAWTSDLEFVTANQYSYTIRYEGENVSGQTEGTPLDRYTADGKMYEYRAIEVTWGLFGQPGGFTAEDVEKTDFSQLHDGQDSPLPGVVVIDHGETGSFRLYNTYDSPTGSLTVQKHFTDRAENDLYPDTTFDVYRYYVNEQGQKSDAALVDTVTLANEQLSTVTTSENANPKVTAGDSAGNNTAEYTFSGLDIYAPDGSYWQYYVVERTINGYTTTVGVDDLDADKVTEAGTSRENPATGTSSPDLCEGGEATAGPDGTQTYAPITGTVLVEDTENENGSITSNDDTVDVTFKNTYVPGDADLEGTKTWTDYSNIFGARPSVEAFINGLSITRSAGGVTETLSAEDGTADELKLVVQSEDATSKDEKENTANLLTYSASGNVFSFTLYNVEQYAPNGVAWTYTVKEDPDDFLDYSVVTGPTSSVRANTSNTFKLENALRGKATVEKSWVDEDGKPADDPYGLRPTSVTMRLQARVTLAEGEGNEPSAWSDAYTVLQQFANSGDMDAQGFDSSFFEKVITSNSGWRATWTHLPVVARALNTSTADGEGDASDALKPGALYEIEYRAVEIMIGAQDISGAVNTSDDTVYDDGVNPYQPSQGSWTGDAQDGWTTQVSNALDDTSISVTKVWDNDSVENTEDAWDTRPWNNEASNGHTWSVTYLLQRRQPGQSWQWVTHFGSTHDDDENLFDLDIVTDTITNGSEKSTVTFEGLPACDTSGTPYEYRVVERVPGGYDVLSGKNDSAEAIATETVDDVTYRYYAVKSTDDSDSGIESQTFTNSMRETTLSGTKTWEDYTTALADNLTEDDMPKLTLWRKAGENGSAEQVNYLYNDGQPEWTEGSNNVWTFEYEGLPAADEHDVAYRYWAVEAKDADGDTVTSDNVTDGFYPTYKDDDPQSSAITNVATRFTFDKVSDFPQQGPEEPEDLQNVELTVYGADSKVYAVWRDVNGTAVSYVWPEGIAEDSVADEITKLDGNQESTGFKPEGIDVGFIIGLSDGVYSVRETSEPPAGYATAPEVTLTIAPNGTINATSGVQNGVSVSVEGANPGGTVTVKVVDPVLRGHLQLTKYVSADGTVEAADAKPLEGATFDLYVQDVDGDGKDELIASGLTSAKGVVTTVGSDVEMNTWSSKGYDADGNVVADPETSGAKDLTHGGKYGQLRDGLPEGTYYFVETDATTGAVMPSGDGAKSGELKITQDNHFAYTNAAVSQTMENEDFSATVTLHKFDAEANNAPIQNATFTVRYTPEDGSYTTLPSSWTETTDANGVLTLDGLEKGTYTVEETSNEGYVNNGFTATFTIDDADDDKTYDITTTDRKDAAVKAIDFQVTSGDGTFVDGQGIPNVPERGSVTIEKVSSASATTKLNGVTFELQKMNGSDWTTVKPTVVAAGLVTDRSYAMNDDNSALVNAAGTKITDSDGRITVSNLKWGTYRFVETASKDGYVGITDKGSAVTSGDLTIGHTSLNPSQTGASAVTNAPVNLELNKQNQVGEALDGAVFTVTPVNGSKFADTAALGNAYDAETGAVRLTTSNGGQATLTAQLVVGGTYEIYEVQAPAGYDPADAKFRVHVETDGSLTVVNESGVAADLPDGWARLDIAGKEDVEGKPVGDGQPDNQFSFIATNRHLAIDLTKVSAEDPDVKLAGVKFRLTGQVMDDGDLTHDFITDENGVIHIECGLQGGTEYTLSEREAPAGYVRIAEDLRFRMNSRGEITPIKTVVEGDESHEVDITDPADIPTGWTVNGDKISLTAEDEPVKLQITKRAPDTEDGKPGDLLEGAEFTVTPADSSTFANEVKGSKTEPRAIATGSDGTASMTAELVVGGTYDITETEAPKGYEKVGGTIRITVGTDGTINVLGSVADDGTVNPQAPAGYTKVDGNAFEVQVENQPIEIGLVKVEADDTATVLAGAEFEIQGVFADSSGRPEIRTFTTNADGTLIYQGATLDNLSEVFVGGTEYTLVEAQAPAGYTLIADPWTFTVTEGGEIETSDPLAAPGESGFAIGADKVTIMAMDESVEASLVKTGIDGPSTDTMVGAKFTLTGDFVNDEHDVIEGRTLTLTTGVDGTLNLFGMKDLADPNDQHTYGLIADNGEYVLTEIEAPQGYEVIEEPFTFTVGTDGRLSPVSAQADAGTEGYTLTATGARITATDTPIRVRLQKAGSDTDGGLLDGATFTLSRVTADADGGESETVLDDDIAPTAAGAVELTGLVGGGTYRLHESEAPAGYELMDDLTFTVDANGEVAIADNGQWAAASADGTVTITATDPAIEVMFDKRDLDGNLLPGAVFQIEGRFVNDATRALDAEPRTLALTMGESGTLALKGMADEDGATYSLVAGQRYMLTEATAPNGYEVIGPFEFTVNPDGTVTAEPGREAAEGEPGYRLSNGEDGVVSVTAFDGPIEVVLYKQSAEGEPLSGAEFRIEGRFVDEATHVLDAEPRAIDLRMDGDSLVLAGMVSGGSTYGLVAGGQYVLTETKAPAGYELIEGGMAFVVGANGTIMATGPNYPFYTVSLSSAEVSITAHDDPIELAIAKVDENGKPLEGAEFMITGDFVGPDGTVEAGSRTVAPGTDPVVVDGFVADGEYVIAETKAPEGYAQVEDVTFVVNADGTITITSGNADGSYTVSDEDEHGIVTISVTNERIPEMSTTGSGTAPAALLAVALLTLGAAIALQRRTMPAGSARGRHRR